MHRSAIPPPCGRQEVQDKLIREVPSMTRYATYDDSNGHPTWGVVQGDGVVAGPSVLTRIGRSTSNDLRAFIEQGKEVWQAVASTAPDMPQDCPRERVRLRAPLVPPRDLFAVGANYAAHAEEANKVDPTIGIPSVPIVFTKAVTSVCGPTDTIAWYPALTTQLDYEIELGVVIGEGGRHIARDAALGHVFGYTVINDISARDVQHGRPGGQWFLGKSMDSFCPMGPWIVTPDEIALTQGLDLTLRVNGEIRQRSNTRHLLFDVTDLITEISRYITLLPGDVIATGTPSGVGAALDPPRFLGEGDVIEAEIEGIGLIRNAVMRCEADESP